MDGWMDTIRYDSGYLTCSKKLTGSASPPVPKIQYIANPLHFTPAFLHLSKCSRSLLSLISQIKFLNFR